MTSQNRLTHLDALRGIAAMLVVVAHFIERTPLKDSFFFAHVNLGQVGVVMFFLLSGMVIPYSLKEGRHALTAFAVSRFFRLYPAYWFSIALAVISSNVFLSTDVPVRSVLLNMTMFQSLLGAPDLFGVYWTLIMEMFFYISCALLFGIGLLGRVSVRFATAVALLVLALIFAVARFYLARKIPVGLPLCLSIMFFGSFWRDVSLGAASRQARLYVAGWFTLFVVCLPFICLLAYNANYGHNENPYSYWVSYLSGMVMALSVTRFMRRPLKSLTYLGTISYSIYLVHPFFLEWTWHVTDMAGAFDPGVFLIYVLATLTLAGVSYALIEKPAVGLARKINRRLQAGSAPLAQPHRPPAS